MAGRSFTFILSAPWHSVWWCSINYYGSGAPKKKIKNHLASGNRPFLSWRSYATAAYGGNVALKQKFGSAVQAAPAESTRDAGWIAAIT